MNTKVCKLNEPGITEEDRDRIYEEASAILRSGGLVAFPTETVYGLGGDGLNPEASKRIYAAKGRPSDNPLIIHIADFDSVYRLAHGISSDAMRLMSAFWPGPMTLIFPKNDIVPKETSGGLDTIAIRYPSHTVAHELIKRSGVYIAAPSANLSGRPSPTKADHVYDDLNGRIDMILDGGEVDIGLESTIIDVSVEKPVILRPGRITFEMARKVTPEITVDPAITEEHARDNIVAKAPGMKYRHYAPKGELTIIEGKPADVVDRINELVRQQRESGKRCGVIATSETASRYTADVVETVGTRTDEMTVAHNLFDVLRKMDDLKIDVIYSESFDRDDIGQAIMNRLLKAAGYRDIKLTGR